jgi:hypothetical protein
MAQDMTAMALPLYGDDRADDRMIVSSADLIEHLAQVVHALDRSRAFSRVAEIGPLRIRLTLHGGANESDIFDAFSSVRNSIPSKKAPRDGPHIDFAIEVIDGKHCGVTRPRLEWRVPDFGPKRLVPGWSDNERTTYFLRGEDGVAVADWKSRHAYVWVPSAAAITRYERAAPFRWIIDGLAQRRGLTIMHAAVIGEGGIGLLIVGEGGRGKSTLALSAVGLGMDYLADDYCLIDTRSPPFPAYRLFNTAKVRINNAVALDWIAGLAHEIEPDGGGKRIFNLEHHAPERLVDRLEIRAVLLPEFTDAALPAIERVSAITAFGRAAPSTVAQCEGAEAQAAAAIGRLTRALPSYRIRMPKQFGGSIEQIRHLIRTLPPLPEDAA